jgi:hypothetical protein
MKNPEWMKELHRMVSVWMNTSPEMNGVMQRSDVKTKWECRTCIQVKSKEKAEIQALSSFGFQYVTEVYLPRKWVVPHSRRKMHCNQSCI